MTASPLIYLAIDNCFASRRWTHPNDWSAVIKDLGLQYVEASADNECDPLYMGPEFLADWVGQVRRAKELTGVSVANFYSGHGTYATTGLTHTDPRVRDRILNDWLKVMARLAAHVDAGLGFACHAFSEPVLQDQSAYAAAEDDLYSRLAELARYAAECGTQNVGLEQMYTPHMIPWTLSGTAHLLQEVYRRSGEPFYLTVDSGHAWGQRRFLRPDRDELDSILGRARSTRGLAGAWLGPRRAYDQMQAAVAAPAGESERHLDQIEATMDAYPYFFAEYDDGDPYLWLERFGCYSPIIHLQQTTGQASAHLPFTAQHNSKGIIHPQPVLAALARSYARPVEPAMPPRCDAVYLTIEVFAPTAALPVDILDELDETVRYWRRWVPRDGMRLDELEAEPESGP
jgi:D-erythrulose 1-phosphate 3-epimerase